MFHIFCYQKSRSPTVSPNLLTRVLPPLSLSSTFSGLCKEKKLSTVLTQPPLPLAQTLAASQTKI